MKTTLLFILSLTALITLACTPTTSDKAEEKAAEVEILKGTVKMQEALLDDAEAKADEAKPAEPKADEPKPSEAKPAEPKADEAKPAEAKPAEPKADEKK